MEEIKKPSNPRMTNPDGMYASEARLEDYFDLRDHFAGLAMQGMLSNPSMFDILNGNANEIASRLSYELADAMLKQREL